MPSQMSYIYPFSKRIGKQCYEIEESYNVFQVIDLKSLELPEHMFHSFLRHFRVLISKKYVLAVSHSTVTLGILTDSQRSAPVINSHLPIDQAGGGDFSDREFEITVVIWQQLTSRSTVLLHLRTGNC
jgi:hypothetical protein